MPARLLISKTARPVSGECTRMISKAKASSKTIWSWALYDFANSAFTTLVVTFIYATYFTKGIAANEIEGTGLWSRGVTLTALTVALLSPVMGAIADQGGYRKRFLLSMTFVCIFALLFLYTALPGEVLKALTWFVIANIAFEMSLVFYNAFLPDIAAADRVGRVSGYGWALGYVGGLLALVLALFGFVQTDSPWLGLSTENGANIRATNFLVAGWYLLFSLPMFFWVKEARRPTETKPVSLLLSSFRQLRATFHEIRKYRQIVKFLLARLIYNDGLITIFAFGGIYAAGTFNFTYEEIIVFGIVLNVAAGLGAYVMGFLDDKLGGKRTILISIFGLGVATLLAVAAPGKALFWVAGILVGIFSGPNQSASRSLMARFVPADKENQFFGFFAFSGKATSFLGPLLLGIITETFRTQRAGIASVLLFFVVGGLLLHLVDEKEGMRIARGRV